MLDSRCVVAFRECPSPGAACCSRSETDKMMFTVVLYRAPTGLIALKRSFV